MQKPIYRKEAYTTGLHGNMAGKVRVLYATEIIRNLCSSDNEYSKLHALISQFSRHFNIFKINTLVIF